MRFLLGRRPILLSTAARKRANLAVNPRNWCAMGQSWMGSELRIVPALANEALVVILEPCATPPGSPLAVRATV